MGAYTVWPLGITRQFSAEYGAYRRMVYQCHNPKHKSFKLYGAVGVEVCRRWRFGFTTRCGFACFVEDMGPRPSNDHFVARLSYTSGFSPDNCEWRVKCNLSVTPGNPQCKYCGGDFTEKCGFDRKNRQRYRCRRCRRAFRARDERDEMPFATLRVPVEKCFQVLSGLEEGYTLRTAAKLAGVDKSTAMRVVKLSGYVRRCHTCGNSLPPGNRFWFCSDGCQIWRTRSYNTLEPKRDPLFSGTANVLRYGISNPLEMHAEHAIELAQRISEKHAAEFLGPCYEAVVECASLGITNKADVLARAKEHVRRMARETQSWCQSIDEMKEDKGYEPGGNFVRWIDEPVVPESSSEVLPESAVDWADFNDLLAKRLGLGRDIVPYLRRHGIDVLAATAELPSDRRAKNLERSLRRYRARLKLGAKPCSLCFPIDHESPHLRLDKYIARRKPQHVRRYGSRAGWKVLT